MNWVNQSIADYYNWLRDNTLVLSDGVNGWHTISTPFIGLFNDTIDIYAKKEKDKIIISDDGDTLQHLKSVGVEFNDRSLSRKEIADRILINYGIHKKENELYVETHIDSFPQKKHNFLTAILELNNLYVLSKPQVASIFKEDVRNYLDEIGVVYTPDFISRGSLGIEFTFDFQIAMRTCEIVIKSFNSLNRTNLPHFLFTWDDIKPFREKLIKKPFQAIAIINDAENKVIKPEFIDAIMSKDARYIYWSQRYDNDNICLLKTA